VARANAASAGFDCLNAAVADRFYLLQIGVPDSTGFVIGVADIITKARAFTTDITFS
jgi:hypothetical protein